MKNISLWLLAVLVLGQLSVRASDEVREGVGAKAETKTDASTDAKATPATETKASEAEAKIINKNPGDGGFTGKSLAVKKYMEDLFEISRKVNSANTSVKNKARLQIENALDWDKVAHDCLGDNNYKKQSQKNITEFKTILKDVIIKTAYTRLDKFWNGTSFKIDKINLKGNTAHVPGKFFVNGGTEILDYYLQEKNGKWSIVDIAYEGLRYSVNIHEQLDAYLSQNTFASLLDKLRKRRQELASDSESNDKRS
jgi:ABC-type transporter MlaC component